MSSSKTTSATKCQKCRCCTNPSSKFFELDSVSKFCGTDKTYKEVLYEITNLKVSNNQEKSLTQKVCQKCSTQLNNCYKFVIQAREVYEQYIKKYIDLAVEDDIKNFHNIPEPLIEVPIDLFTVDKSALITNESPLASAAIPLAVEEIKSEPMTIECPSHRQELINIDYTRNEDIIKEEKPEYLDYNNTGITSTDKVDELTELSSELLVKESVLVQTHEEEREHLDSFNTDSEDDEDAEDPISEDDFDKDLSKAPIAISCDICHKIYKDKVALRTHKHYTHMPEEKKRPCPLCSFKSSRLSNLKVHIGVVHGADKVKEIFKPVDDNGVQFPCSICQQTFRRKDTLQKHIKRIHQNPQPKEPRIKTKAPKEKERFLCTYCGGSFRTKYGLSRHAAIHTGERPFPCEICQKTFKRPEDLYMHRIIHSDEKPHQCLQCGKAFKRSDKLKVHMRVHSELRPYKCKECEKTFKYPNVLSTHMLIHTGQNPFHCKTCGESFSLRSSFNTHCLRNGHLYKESLSSTNLENYIPEDVNLADNSSLEYVHINTIYDKVGQKCRCCTSPSSSFIQLDSHITNKGNERTYKDILYEITHINIAVHHETILPQQVCHKCGIQIKNSYKFIRQARDVSEQYLYLIKELNTQEDIKNIEHLQESLIEIAEAPNSEQANQELKDEPLSIESTMAIKEEQVESEILTTTVSNNASQEKEDFVQNSNTDDHSSADESDEPESVRGIDMDLKNEPIARCCDICHKIYRNEKFLKVHKRYTHMPEENKLPCPLCTYKASRTSALKVHIGLVHGHDKVNEYFKSALNSGKKYSCNLCPRSYARKDSLRKHVKRKHINKPCKDDGPKKSKILKPKEKQRFLCTYCGQSFSSKGGLESHALTHTADRPFSCEICSKTFKRLKDLQLHRVIHSDEKPHQCSECGKAFKRVDKLKIHMRVHSELRPYKCNECEKTFKYPSVLRTHMHIHTGQTPFPCKTCGEAFSLRASLNKHCLKHGHVK